MPPGLCVKPGKVKWGHTPTQPNNEPQVLSRLPTPSCAFLGCAVRGALRLTFKCPPPDKILAGSCHCGQLPSMFQSCVWITVWPPHHLTPNLTPLSHLLGVSSSIPAACPSSKAKCHRISQPAPCPKPALHTPARPRLLSCFSSQQV